MYVVTLTDFTRPFSQRFLDRDLRFVSDLSAAQAFASLQHALQAVHDRGYQARAQCWPTGSDTLGIVEVSEKRMLTIDKVII